MNKVTKYYARFLSPGTIVANDWTADVESLDPNAIVWPEHAYAFTLHERDDMIDGEAVYTGQPHQVGPMYFHPDSKVESLAEVKSNPRATRILKQNMESNDWTHIVWSRWGNWPQPFDPAVHTVLPRERQVA